MKIELLNEFVVFAKHMNFSEAAKELFLSQPGLSTHMSNLEKELGFTLIDRDNGPTLSPAGIVFLDCAQDILDRYERGLEECRATSSAPPLVRILAVSSDSTFMRMLGKIKGILFTFVPLESDMPVLKGLQKNIIDIGVCTDFTLNPSLREKAIADNIAWFYLEKGTASISMMKTHPFAQKESISRADLANTTIVINGGTHYDMWRAVIQEYLGEGIDLKFRLDPIGSISNLAITDFGDSVHICGSEANREYLSKRDDVVIFEELDDGPITYDTIIAYRSDSGNENVAACIEALKAQL